MANIRQLLLDYGLAEKEAEVFLSIVKQGESGASTISSDTGITRTHIYDIVFELKKLGLITEIQRRGIKKYQSIDHDGLVAIFGQKQSQLKKLKEEMTMASAEFNKLQVGVAQKTRVRFFDGKEGIKRIYTESRNDLLKTQEKSAELLTIFSPDQIQKVFPKWYEHENFMDHGLNITKRGIVCHSDIFNDYVKDIEQRENNHQYKHWPKHGHDFLTDTLCWLGKIAYIDLADVPSGIIIENRGIVCSFKMRFDFMWYSL